MDRMARDTLSQRPRGGMHWKKQLADAHQRSRDLANRLAAAESGVEARVQAERQARIKAEETSARAIHALDIKVQEEAERAKHRPVSDAELVAIAALVMTEALPATPARQRLIDELAYRGVLAETP
jgi:hypothetical protein